MARTYTGASIKLTYLGQPLVWGGENPGKWSMDRQEEASMEEASMDDKLISVGSKWLITKDCEGHMAGEVLEVARLSPRGWNGEFTTCPTNHNHGLSLFLGGCFAAAVALRDEAFWTRYAPAEEFRTQGTGRPRLGQVSVWEGSSNWSIWLGVGGEGCLLLARSKYGNTTVGHTAFNVTGRHQWRVIQDVGQAGPLPLDKVGYTLASLPPASDQQFLAAARKMGEAANSSLNKELEKALGRYVPAAPSRLCSLCGGTATAGAKAALCEQHIFERQLDADLRCKAAMFRLAKPAPGCGDRPSSHAIAAGGVFDLHVPRPKKAWRYPEVDEHDLLPDA